jgi:hypothetical protein
VTKEYAAYAAYGVVLSEFDSFVVLLHMWDYTRNYVMSSFEKNTLGRKKPPSSWVLQARST